MFGIPSLLPLVDKETQAIFRFFAKDPRVIYAKSNLIKRLCMESSRQRTFNRRLDRMIEGGVLTIITRDGKEYIGFPSWTESNEPNYVYLYYADDDDESFAVGKYRPTMVNLTLEDREQWLNNLLENMPKVLRGTDRERRKTMRRVNWLVREQLADIDEAKRKHQEQTGGAYIEKAEEDPQYTSEKERL